MKAPTEKQLQKLPLWAQDHIRVLTMRRDELTARIQAMGAENVDTNTYVRHYTDEALRINLPRDSEVTFRYGERGEDVVEVRVFDDGTGHRGVRVSTGHSRVSVEPSAANLVYVFPRGWRE